VELSGISEAIFHYGEPCSSFKIWLLKTAPLMRIFIVAWLFHNVGLSRHMSCQDSWARNSTQEVESDAAGGLAKTKTKSQL